MSPVRGFHDHYPERGGRVQHAGPEEGCDQPDLGPTARQIGESWQRIADTARVVETLNPAEAKDYSAMRALARAFADTVDMAADGLIPTDAGMEFVAVMESRLAGLGWRLVRAGRFIPGRSCRHGINPDECEFCDGPGADKEGATRQAIRRRGAA